jgi:hypothetical protein
VGPDGTAPTAAQSIEADGQVDVFGIALVPKVGGAEHLEARVEQHRMEDVRRVVALDRCGKGQASEGFALTAPQLGHRLEAGTVIDAGLPEGVVIPCDPDRRGAALPYRGQRFGSARGRIRLGSVPQCPGRMTCQRSGSESPPPVRLKTWKRDGSPSCGVTITCTGRSLPDTSTMGSETTTFSTTWGPLPSVCAAAARPISR